MAQRLASALTREQRRLVARFIARGDFRDEADFERFAVRRALAQLALRELREMRAKDPPRKMSREEIIEQTRRIRRQMSKEHGSAAFR